MSVPLSFSETLGINPRLVSKQHLAAELVQVVTHRLTLAERLGTECNFLLLPGESNSRPASAMFWWSPNLFVVFMRKDRYLSFGISFHACTYLC